MGTVLDLRVYFASDMSLLLLRHLLEGVESKLKILNTVETGGSLVHGFIGEHKTHASLN